MKVSVIKEVDLLIERYPTLKLLRGSIIDSISVIIRAYRNKGKILVCGNGGSAADSLHIVGEFMKSFALNRKISGDICERFSSISPQYAEYYINNLQFALPAISLVNEVGLCTAYSNDVASDLVFAQQVFGQGKSGDILIAISTSGSSLNVIHALNIAKSIGMITIGLTGKNGSDMASLCDVLINVPSEITYQIQELHLPVYHTICLAVEKEFFGEDK